MLTIRVLRSVLAMTVLLVGGCGLPILDLHETINLHRASFRNKVAGQTGLAKEFLACTKQAYDERRPSAQGAEAATSSSLVNVPAVDNSPGNSQLVPIRALIARVRATRQPQADSLSVLEDLLRDWTGESRQLLDLGKLKKVVEVIWQWHARLDFDEDDLSQDASRFIQLLLAYNKAYFGNVRYLPASTASGTTIHAVRKVTSSGFTDRNGNTWIFPGLSLDVAKEGGMPFGVAGAPVNSPRISADLARIFLEAFFDAAFREPAVQGATALRVDWKNREQSYPAFEADRAPISLESLARITRDALRTEAAVMSLVGKAVRSGGLLSIQNETVAASLETAAGVIAKKLVEHDGFCYYEVMKAR
jgi:hypothetical protein